MHFSVIWAELLILVSDVEVWKLMHFSISWRIFKIDDFDVLASLKIIFCIGFLKGLLGVTPAATRLSSWRSSRSSRSSSSARKTTITNNILLNFSVFFLFFQSRELKWDKDYITFHSWKHFLYRHCFVFIVYYFILINISLVLYIRDFRPWETLDKLKYFACFFATFRLFSLFTHIVATC